MPTHDEYPFRVYFRDGRMISIRQIGPSQVCAHYPDAIRWERADVKQPPQIIEDVSDE